MERINGPISEQSDESCGGSFVEDATTAILNSSNPNRGFVAPVSSGANVGAIQRPSGELDIRSFVDAATIARYSSNNLSPGYVAPLISGVNVGPVRRPSGEFDFDFLSRFAELGIGSAPRTTPAYGIDGSVNNYRPLHALNTPDQSETHRLSEVYWPRMSAPVQATAPQNHQPIEQSNYFNVPGVMGNHSFLGTKSNGAPQVYPNVSYPSYGNENLRYPSVGYVNNDDLRSGLSRKFARLDSSLLAKISILNQNFSEWNRNSATIDYVFSEIKDCAPDLMVHHEGNYFIQNFFRVCKEHHMDWFISCVLGGGERRVLDICENQLGAIAVQKMLNHLTTPRQRCEALHGLKDHTIKLSKGQNSHHVIMQCLTDFSSEETKDIQRVLADNYFALAIDRNGCVVLQRCADCTYGEHRDRMLGLIAASALDLSGDVYGNYVVSHLVKRLRIPHVTAEILSQLNGNYIYLSMNKYASHVVEACLTATQGAQQFQIITEIMNDNNFLRVLQDPFGNYVAQIALKVSKNNRLHSLHHNLVRLICSHSRLLQSHPHGKSVLAAARGSSLHRI